MKIILPSSKNTDGLCTEEDLSDSQYVDDVLLLN